MRAIASHTRAGGSKKPFRISLAADSLLAEILRHLQMLLQRRQG